MKTLLFMVLGSMLFFSCQENTTETTENSKDNYKQVNNETDLPEDTDCIHKPWEDVDVQKQKFVINPTEESIIKLDNGGSIKIPANAIVDKSGSTVDGEVTINFKEYHSLGDVLISGIPMEYDGGHFKTAGMFNIKAEQDGQDLDLSKPIEMNIASNEDGGYNFYELDEKSGDWSSLKENIEETENPNYDPIVAAGPPSKTSKNAPVLNIQCKYDHIPELKDYKGLFWQSVSTLDEENPDKFEGFYDVKWTDIKLEPHPKGFMHYTMYLSAKDTSFRTIVKPALQGSRLKKAIQRFDDIKKEKEMELEISNMESQKQFVRSVEIDGFGTYNYDIMFKQDNSLKVLADFNFPVDVPKKAMTIHLISKEENAVISYDYSAWSKFSIRPENRNIIVAPLPNNKVAIVRPSKLKGLKPSAEHTFNLELVDVEIKNPKDIQKVILEYL